MVKVEHWRVYAVYFGIENSPLGEAILKATLVQSFNEGYGTPISNECLLRCLQIPIERANYGFTQSIEKEYVGANRLCENLL